MGFLKAYAIGLGFLIYFSVMLAAFGNGMDGKGPCGGAALIVLAFFMFAGVLGSIVAAGMGLFRL